MNEQAADPTPTRSQTPSTESPGPAELAERAELAELTELAGLAESSGLAELVGEWLDWSQAAEALGVSVSKVRQLIREHQLAAAVPTPTSGQQVPADLCQDGEIVKGVPGVVTVLHDGGYDDREILTWLFTSDESLPGRPIDALRENRGSEVKRRAQAMSF